VLAPILQAFIEARKARADYRQRQSFFWRRVTPSGRAWRRSTPARRANHRAPREAAVSSPLGKQIPLFRSANQSCIPCRLVPPKGAARDRHERGAGCGGRRVPRTYGIGCGRRRCVVLTPQRLVSSWRKSASDGVNKHPFIKYRFDDQAVGRNSA
jgi:hypothetical protein